MKKIKQINGYTIYLLTERDEKKGRGYAGEYSIYFSSDIREYGIEYSYPEFDAIDSLEIALELCSNNFAIAKELVEEETTAATLEEIEEKEKELDKMEVENMEKTKKYYYGNEVSSYGLQYNRVDYRTFAKAFDAVLNNDIMSELQCKGFYFEQVGGFIDNSEEIEELEEKIEELESVEEMNEEIEEQIEELEEQIEELENEEPGEIYQYYVVGEYATRILEENNEIVFYCEELDLYIWGVTHWGTSWDYVLTGIEI